MAANPLLPLLQKKKFADAYKLARQEPKLVDARDGDDDSPFQWACRFGDQATMLELLKLKPKLTVRDAEDELPIELVADGSVYATAAHVAARTAMAKALLAAKSPLGDKVLAKACQLGAGKARDLVKLLVAQKAKADFVEEDGSTILHVAAEYDLPEALEYGLKAGVDPNVKIRDSDFRGGTTALHIAVKKRRTEMVAKLVAAGAKPDVANKRKETPLTLANGALRTILEGKSNGANGANGAATTSAAKAKTSRAAKPPKKGMNELLAKLWKSPRDTSLLSVYADGLIEQGEDSRGEYIRLALLDKPTPAQTKRKEQLRKKDRGRWLGEARRLVSEWVDSESTPGFVAVATVNIEKALAHFDEIAALGPELTLRFTPIKTRLLTKKLAEIPLGKKVYGLSFYNTTGTFGMNRDWLDDTSMGILGPAMAGLRSLILAPCIQANEGEGFTPVAFDHLAPVRPSLESLTLDFTDSTPTREILDAATPKMFPALKTLTLVGLEAADQKRIRSIWSKAAPKLSFA
jgi:uncharacterized protein (TIGR02996 family)